ncbi:flagellin [Clostridium algidicarnis]|uniref:flagellin N-terminal helical domain-containing protein n=1 Tax=Clostridium algidicarnis TaxID=37659 RepID=UPI001C0D6EC0|nr:flagellin [Clostridium algidicarnis]MBU3208858.1 flagellin [Clostridium algidicarnis]
MRLSHNLMSLNVYRNYTKNVASQSKSMSKVSSGDKISKAMDNPAGMGQREQIRMQLRGLQMSQRNMQDGISMLQTVEGGLDNITTALNRVRELTISSGGATTKDDRAVIQKEIEQMLKSIDDIANNTEFNGVKLLAKTGTEPDHIKMASGANVGDTLVIPANNLTSGNLTNKEGTLSLKDIKVNEGKIDEALGIIDGSMDKVLSIRSKYGAIQNRMESLYDIQGQNSLVMEGADSNIGDVDIAEEMMHLAKHNLLVEAGNAMMVQTNRMPQDVLRVLERLK